MLFVYNPFWIYFLQSQVQMSACDEILLVVVLCKFAHKIFSVMEIKTCILGGKTIVKLFYVGILADSAIAILCDEFLESAQWH